MFKPIGKWTFVFLFSLILAVLVFYRNSPNQRTWIERAVEREFSVYSKIGIQRRSIEAAWEKVRRIPEFHRYKIIGSKVYGQPSNIRNLLQLLVDTGPVPDVDFIYFNEDVIKKDFSKRSAFRQKAPILVSAKHKSLSKFILFSDWLYDPTDQKGGWNLHLQTINENQSKWAWESKIEKLFWRGSPFDGKHFGMYRLHNWKEIPRGQLVFQSHQNPELIDAAFSFLPKKCLSEDPERCLREMGPHSYVSILDQLEYKYHLLIDGVTCAFLGTYWKLLSGCVPFKQESHDIMFYYPELVAWKHYIPVRNDLSDLQEKIAWARNHDGEAKKIAENAREFALTHVMPEHILNYCRAILHKYAALQTFQPTLEPFRPGDTERQF